MTIEIFGATLTAREADYALAFLVGETTTQPYKKELHKKIKSFFAIDNAYTFMGGRSALYAIMKSLELEVGDEVLLPAFTCQCVINSIEAVEAKVKFVDIELETYGMDADSLANSITPKTKVLFIQHTFGMANRDLFALLSIAKQNNLIVIEDCAHALGASIEGQLLGTLGDVAFFSSERTKLINTIHGGFAFTKNLVIKERLDKIYQNFLYPPMDFIKSIMKTLLIEYKTYQDKSSLIKDLNLAKISDLDPLPQMFKNEFLGLVTQQYSYLMPDSVAAIFLMQWENLSARLQVREKMVAHWSLWAQENNYLTPTPVQNSKSAWLRYPVLVEPELKNKLIKDPYFLKDEIQAAAGVWFISAKHPNKFSSDAFLNASIAQKRCINLPTYNVPTINLLKDK